MLYSSESQKTCPKRIFENPSHLTQTVIPLPSLKETIKKKKHVESWPVSVYNKKRDLICLFNPVTAIPTHKTCHNPYREKSWVESVKKQNFVNLGRDPFKKVRSLDYFASSYEKARSETIRQK